MKTNGLVLTGTVFTVLSMSLLGVSCSQRLISEHSFNKNSEPPLVAQSAPAVPQSQTPVSPTVPANKPATIPLPPLHSITVLPVPFAPQAPYAVWDATHQEACEEASMLMAAEYFKGNKNEQLAADYAEAEILKLVAWERGHGYAVDLTAAEVVRVLADYYQIEARVEAYNPLLIQESIKAGKLVILPAAGRLLGNPYFRRPGPLYHMLVVRGFDGDEFITNDPGTKRGENFRYQESTLRRAVHDWNGGEVEQGEQVMVIVGAGT